MAMRSGSSELLLEQQQQLQLEQQEQELRIRKLKELAPQKKTPPKKHRTCKERAAFYATSTLAFFSVTAGASLLFLVPLYVDPAISTLASDFVDVPTICTTTRREDLTGLVNCSWSSCREGCTSDVFKCTHIFVSYVDSTNLTLPYYLQREFDNLLSTRYYDSFSTYSESMVGGSNLSMSAVMQLANNLTMLFEQQPQSEEATLLVNIKGCGYPPSVKCKNFTDVFGQEGAMFPCYFSKLNKTLVMTRYKRDDQVNLIVNFFLVPFVTCIIASFGLCIIHCDCRCKKERRRHRQQYRRPRIDNLR